MSKIIKKVWGKEIIYKNDDRYCVKLLSIDQGKCSSIHFHKNKLESFLMSSGKILLEIWKKLPEDYTGKDLITLQNPIKRIILEPHNEFTTNDNSVITIEPLTPHRFHGLEDVNNTFFEASTKDKKEDSYRALSSMGLYNTKE